MMLQKFYNFPDRMALTIFCLGSFPDAWSREFTGIDYMQMEEMFSDREILLGKENARPEFCGVLSLNTCETVQICGVLNSVGISLG